MSKGKDNSINDFGLGKDSDGKVCYDQTQNQEQFTPNKEQKSCDFEKQYTQNSSQRSINEETTGSSPDNKGPIVGSQSSKVQRNPTEVVKISPENINSLIFKNQETPKKVDGDEESSNEQYLNPQQETKIRQVNLELKKIADDDSLPQYQQKSQNVYNDFDAGIDDLNSFVKTNLVRFCNIAVLECTKQILEAGDLIHSTYGAITKDEEFKIQKCVNFIKDLGNKIIKFYNIQNNPPLEGVLICSGLEVIREARIYSNLSDVLKGFPKEEAKVLLTYIKSKLPEFDVERLNNITEYGENPIVYTDKEIGEYIKSIVGESDYNGIIQEYMSYEQLKAFLGHIEHQDY